MAEFLFRGIIDREKERGADASLLDNIIVKSRSVSTDYEPENSPASPQGVEVLMNDYNFDMKEHRSKLLSEDDVREALMIVPVKKDLGRYIQQAFPNHIESLKDKLFYFSSDIEDPWRQPVSVFQHCAVKMNVLLLEVFHALTDLLMSYNCERNPHIAFSMP